MRIVANLQGVALPFTGVQREYTIWECIRRMFDLSSFHLAFMTEKLVCCLIASHSQTVGTRVAIQTIQVISQLSALSPIPSTPYVLS